MSPRPPRSTRPNPLFPATTLFQSPWWVINTAGVGRVHDGERNAERCFQENAFGAEVLAHACARLGIPYVTFSSDLVFDGQMGRPYVESDAVCPIGKIGRAHV